jgi:hypothetical protein
MPYLPSIRAVFAVLRTLFLPFVAMPWCCAGLRFTLARSAHLFSFY